MEDKQFKESLDRYLMEGDEDNAHIYKEVDLTQCSEIEKAEALVDFLIEDNAFEGGTISETQYGNFVVNEKKVLRGTSPVQYNRQIQALEKLLTKAQVQAIKDFISDKNHTVKLRDRLYKRVKKQLEKKHDTEEYEYLKKECLFPQNLVYHLLSDGETQHEKQCQRAIFKFKIEDLRERVEDNDGEYAVLTDSEADDRAMEYLSDGDYWQMAVESGNTTSSMEDYNDEVLSIDGRGSLLASYDGVENSVEKYGIDYYIYRVD